MDKAIQRDILFEESANIFKILSSPLRLRLIHYISFCPRTVEECSEKLNISIQNASLHLVQLAKVGILEVSKIKNYRYYSLGKNPMSEVVLDAMRSDDRDIMPNGKRFVRELGELVKLVNSNKAILVDLRDEEESRYIEVKKSIPFRESLSKLEKFLRALPKKEVIFFCKGRLCERLAQVVEEATKLNVKSQALCLTAKELEVFNNELTKEEQ